MHAPKRKRGRRDGFARRPTFRTRSRVEEDENRGRISPRAAIWSPLRAWPVVGEEKPAVRLARTGRSVLAGRKRHRVMRPWGRISCRPGPCGRSACERPWYVQPHAGSPASHLQTSGSAGQRWGGSRLTRLCSGRVRDTFQQESIFHRGGGPDTQQHQPAGSAADGGEAAAALAEINRRQERVIETVLVPVWYWWVMAAGIVAIGAARDNGKAVVQAIAIPLAVLVMAGLTARTIPAVRRRSRCTAPRSLVVVAQPRYSR